MKAVKLPYNKIKVAVGAGDRPGVSLHVLQERVNEHQRGEGSQVQPKPTHDQKVKNKIPLATSSIKSHLETDREGCQKCTRRL